MQLRIAQTPIKIAIEHAEPQASCARREAVERERAVARRMLRATPGGDAGADLAWETAVDRLIDHAASECGRGPRDGGGDVGPLRGLLDRMRIERGDDGRGPGRQA